MSDNRELGFSEAEYGQLRKELTVIKKERRLTFGLLEEGSGVSEPTIKRFLKGGRSPQPQTFSRLKRYVESLRPLIDETRELDTDLYHYLKRRMNIDADYQRRQVQRFRGTYICYRLSVFSKEIVATYFKVWDQEDDHIPRFTHIESVSDEKNLFGDAPRRILRHSGFLLAKERRLYFLSAASGNFRQLIGLASSNLDVKDFAGVMVSVDAKERSPFAARILARYSGPNHEIGQISSKLGLFKLNDAKFATMLPSLRNDPTEDGVLLAPDMG